MTIIIEQTIDVGRRLPATPILQHAPAALPATADVVIIGGGVIGLSIAWRAALAGLATVVVERDEAGAGASLAATGMLAAAAEFETGGESLLPFALASQRRWPRFRDELEQASGVSLDFETRGTLVVALTRDETSRLRAKHDLHVRAGLPTRWLAATEARDLEPGLRSSTTAALLCADDHQVDPRRLIPALRLALKAAGATLVEHCDVLSIDRENGRCAGVVTNHGACRAPSVVVAAGAWAARAGLLPESIHAPVRPLKGQSIALRMNRMAPATRHVIWTEQVHMAPKADGRLIVGATVEECGFDPSITAGGLFALLEGARRALPCVEEMSVDAVWSGFRPTSDDDAPILGATPVPGLLLAVGHHRNGILLAPATADAIVDLLQGRNAAPEAAALDLARFRRSA
ncbi:MAG: glycine oxidase ThiO [Hyphomicrobiales bacterium]|nr:glycine oxidase ThiO [Hyphomicrobiales bacterium]